MFIIPFGGVTGHGLETPPQNVADVLQRAVVQRQQAQEKGRLKREGGQWGCLLPKEREVGTWVERKEEGVSPFSDVQGQDAA